MNEKPYHHGDLRTALMEKAIEMIDDMGVHALSLRKVAVACGVSHAAPYAHFANKEELLRDIEKHITGQFAAALKKSVKEVGETPEGLVELGCAFVMFFTRNRQYYNLIYNYLGIQAGGDHAYEPYDFFVGFIFKMLERMDYPEALRGKTFGAHFAVIQGITALAVIDSCKSDSEWEAIARDLLTSNYLLTKKPTGVE